MYPGIDKTYFINLDRRTDRRQECQKLFTALGITAERVVPVNPAAASINDTNVSLCQTTAKILQEAQEKGFQRVLILEDDIDFVNPPATLTFPENFDLFYLGFVMHYVSKIKALGEHLQLLSSCSASHAIIYPAHMYPDLIASLNRVRCIDEHLQTLQPSKLIFCSNPPFAVQRNSPSDLSHEPYRSNMRGVTLDQYNLYAIRQGAKPIIVNT